MVTPGALPLATEAASILGCTVHAVTIEDALAWCLEACRAEAGRARVVLTANASHLVDIQDNQALRQACGAADLVVPDGMSLVWAGRFLGHAIPARIAGIDLLSELLRVAQLHGLRVFLLGARPEVIARFVEHCAQAYPGLVLAGWRDGYFTPPQHEQVVQQIAASRADILFVGMPSPFKDIWCERHRDRFGARLIMGVGGSFDVLAGVVPRAPTAMQRAGLEWAWRLLQEPRRLWRRYLFGNARFVWLVLREKLGVRAGPMPPVNAGQQPARERGARRGR